jgi:hypothetical protein
MPPTIDRITSQRHVRAACAVDAVPLLAHRVAAMLWWGRRITVAHRWLDSDSRIELKVGLSVDKQMGDRAVRLTTAADHAGFAVHLAPGIEAFGFSAYASDDNASEAQAWKRYHDGGRRNITIVELDGGMLGDGGPGRNDHLSFRYWNEHRVGREIVVGFDTEGYSQVWQERENAGYAAGGEDFRVPYCKALAQVGDYRVRCAWPTDGGVCPRAGEHIEVPADPAALLAGV